MLFWCTFGIILTIIINEDSNSIIFLRGQQPPSKQQEHQLGIGYLSNSLNLNLLKKRLTATTTTRTEASERKEEKQ